MDNMSSVPMPEAPEYKENAPMPEAPAAPSTSDGSSVPPSTPTPAPTPSWENIPAASMAYTRVGLGMLAFLLLPLFFSIFASTIVALVSPEEIGSVWFTWVNQIFSLYLTTAPLCLLIIGRPRGNVPVPEKKKLKFGHMLILLCIMESIAIIGSMISTFLTNVFGLLTGNTPVDPLETILNGTPLWVIFLIVVVIGPIVEEIVCRKAILDRLLPFGEMSAIFFSAICFGVMHENFFQLFYAVGVGLILGFVYTRTRRLFHVSLLHILFNFLGSFVPMLVLRNLDLNALMNFDSTMPAEEILPWLAENLLPFIGLLAYEVLVYGMALLGIIFFCLFIRRVKFEKCPLPLPKGMMAGTAVGNFGMIPFFIVGWVLLIISLFL